MSELKKITAHNNERAADPHGIVYALTICPHERVAEWRDYSGASFAKRVLEREVFDRLMSEINRWMSEAGPDDVTYYGRFKTAEEYSAWCKDLLCDDHEVRWDVLCEYTDGSFASYICTGSTGFPETFGKLLS